MVWGSFLVVCGFVLCFLGFCGGFCGLLIFVWALSGGYGHTNPTQPPRGGGGGGGGGGVGGGGGGGGWGWGGGWGGGVGGVGTRIYIGVSIETNRSQFTPLPKSITGRYFAAVRLDPPRTQRHIREETATRRVGRKSASGKVEGSMLQDC